MAQLATIFQDLRLKYDKKIHLKWWKVRTLILVYLWNLILELQKYFLNPRGFQIHLLLILLILQIQLLLRVQKSIFLEVQVCSFLWDLKDDAFKDLDRCLHRWFQDLNHAKWFSLIWMARQSLKIGLWMNQESCTQD